MIFLGDSCFHNAYSIVHKGNYPPQVVVVYAIRTMQYALLYDLPPPL
jgi:hypothetical protein